MRIVHLEGWVQPPEDRSCQNFRVWRRAPPGRSGFQSPDRRYPPAERVGEPAASRSPTVAPSSTPSLLRHLEAIPEVDREFHQRLRPVSRRGLPSCRRRRHHPVDQLDDRSLRKWPRCRTGSEYARNGTTSPHDNPQLLATPGYFWPHSLALNASSFAASAARQIRFSAAARPLCSFYEACRRECC